MSDLISRQAAIDAMCLVCGHDCDKSKFVYDAPQDEQVIMCPEHYALSTLPLADRPTGKWIDADIYVTATLYDDEHEEYRDERMTISDCLDRFTDEGCPTESKPKQERCKWIKYDYRTICPKNHDIDNPYWRIPENTERLKYCPYCGKEIEVTE